MNIVDLFDRPKVISIIADVNSGKSNFLYSIIKDLKENFELSLHVYGLRNEIEDTITFNSLGELELIKNSVIILDEFATLFDLNDRKKRKQIENTLRLINHNNNILILSGLPENFKKFISAKLDVIIYKKATYDDLVNGSRVKRVLLDYGGDRSGSCILNMAVNEALVFTNRYDIVTIPYLEEFDSKKDNIKIVQKRENED